MYYLGELIVAFLAAVAFGLAMIVLCAPAVGIYLAARSIRRWWEA